MLLVARQSVGDAKVMLQQVGLLPCPIRRKESIALSKYFSCSKAILAADTSKESMAAKESGCRSCKKAITINI